MLKMNLKINKNKRAQKKAQITLFVIFGLILLIVFIVLLLIRKSAEPKTMTGVDEILNEIKTGSVKNHIVSCISETAMDALEKIGANGGLIYSFEGGTTLFQDVVVGEDYLNYTYLDNPYFVAYGLKKNQLCSQINYDVPDYPYLDKLLSLLPGIYSSNCLYDSFYSAYDGFYGQNDMRKLCYAARDSSCEGFAKGAVIGFTIQKQLEDFVSRKIPICTNFSAFTERMSAEITIAGDPKTEAIIHDSEIILLVEYPVKITFENQEPITEIINYQVNIDVRLGRIYNFLYNVFSLDSKKIEFNLDEEFISSSFWNNGLELRRIKDPCPLCDYPFNHDDIIEVIDRKSKVKGRAFLFRSAVENRRPALDKIDNLTIDLESSRFINIDLSSYDPDDTDMTYYFLSLGVGRDECTGTGSFTPTPTPTPSPYSFGQGWCEQDPRIQSSLPYAKLWAPVTKYDVGDHEVRVLALDDSGMFDYQTFQIKIFDSRYTKSPRQSCIGNCTSDGNSNCASGWCTIAANECNSECLGGEYSYVSTSTCTECVSPIVYSGKRHDHVDCSSISDKNTCISKMTDCFWIRENISNTYIESCYNDIALDTVKLPAYILT
ncbi:MAG: hypothetical protein KJ685_01350 [Nanoarchaeota archaeon]|nr:hypothetical protein [Nanoarchaeota archaeon]